MNCVSCCGAMSLMRLLWRNCTVWCRWWRDEAFAKRRTEVDITGHGVGAGLRLASKKGIRLALIVGEEEQLKSAVTVRDLVSSEEKLIPREEVKALIWRHEWGPYAGSGQGRGRDPSGG